MRIILLLFFVPILLCAQKKTSAPSCNEEYYRYVIGTLANDSMEGRLPGTKAELQSANFIEKEFQAAGCKPLQKGKFAFPFDYISPDSVTPVHSSGNVIAKIETKSDYCIIISAHYDHIGFGKFHSNDPFTHAIHNGADDNASGVALMLGLAGWCNEHTKELHYDIVFIAFSGEEDGLFGSKYFLSQNLVDTSKIICDLNFDMVGHLDLQRPLLEVEGVRKISAWDSILPNDSSAHFNVERDNVMIKGGADHCTFLDAHIPAVLFSTGLTAYYHRPEDDLETINFSGMLAISDYMKVILCALNKKKDLESILK
ncbi:MAG: M28 family peptidase [Bacteroidetes bacterium]|nr:M28 family peptidase [Bacteroidota bacterium]